MGKMKLELEALAVETFAPDEIQKLYGGTIKARSEGDYGIEGQSAMYASLICASPNRSKIAMCQTGNQAGCSLCPETCMYESDYCPMSTRC